MFKDFPLQSIHKSAFKLAEAANCAGEQGKYWEMNTRFFAHEKAPNIEGLPAHAQAVGLDKDAFQQCLNSEKYASEIRDDIAEARGAGVRSTPTFLLGFIQSDGMVKAVKMIRGAQPYAVFKQTLDSLLASKEQ